MAYNNRILTEIGYQDIIRDKLGLSTEILPDSKIDRQDAIELAETIIIKRVSDWQSLQGEDLLYLKMAVIFYACGLLAKGFGQGILKYEKLSDYQYENFQMDIKQREQDFLDKVDEFLSKISTYMPQDKKIFEVIPGYSQDA